MKTILSRLKGLMSQLRGRRLPDEFREEEDFLTAYSRHTDRRVEKDPRLAIGGMWDEIGDLQYQFLLSQGLQPEDRMLDVGCGTLRGGRHFIRYLAPGNYTGMDISPRAIESGRELVEAEGLQEKRPRLVVSENKNLRFEEFRGEAFDVILAQSVFTHLKQEHIAEFFRHVRSVMAPGARVFFTFNQEPEFREITVKDFAYPYSFFQDLAERNGLSLEYLAEQYRHPRDQRMVRAECAAS